MDRSLYTSLNIVEIRERVMLEVRDRKRASMPWYPFDDPDLLRIHFLIVTYMMFAVEFGIEPYEDMLPNLGWPGQVLYELFGKTTGVWEAFRRLVERSHNLPWQTSLTEGDVVLRSLPVRFVYRSLLSMSGVKRVETNPLIPDGSGRRTADFLVRAVTGLTVYVEVSMVSSRADGERPFLPRSRNDLLQKVGLYQKAGFDPVIIWSDEVAAPRVLAERLNDIRARLGLPTRPPAPLAWYEEIG